MLDGIPVLPEIVPAESRFYGFLFVTMILSMRVSSGVTITSMRALFAQQCCVAGCIPDEVRIAIYVRNKFFMLQKVELLYRVPQFAMSNIAKLVQQVFLTA